MKESKQIKGSELFVKALIEEGVDTLFGYPGGQAIDLFDALYECKEVNVVLPRHEQALVHAADGYARSTGKVGVCLVTSGPGATNIVTGIATANYDSVPLVCFTGQVPTSLIGNDAFQEVDTMGICRSVCKYAVTVRKREDLGRIIKEAFYIARSGKPGPVVVDLPKDVQIAMGSADYPTEVNIRGYKPNEGVHVGQLKKAITLLKNAKKPVFLLGGGVNIARANDAMTELANRVGAPVVTTIMGKGDIPVDNKNYIGNVGIHGIYAANRAIAESDLLFSIGTRFNDRITGKTSEFAKNATIVHVDVDPAAISKNVRVDVPIVADAMVAINKLNEFTKDMSFDNTDWLKTVTDWKKSHPVTMEKRYGDRALTPQDIIETINKHYKKGVILSTDVGQNQLWATQYFDVTSGRCLLTSGGLGTMGYGFPAIIGAKIGNPDTPCVCISGDGGAQMNIQELATAVTLEIPVVFCILNNSYLGNVRQWQEMFFKKRYSHTYLGYPRSESKHGKETASKDCPDYSPDFVKLAESYGAYGIRVKNSSEVLAAFKEADKHKDAPTVIEFLIDSDVNVYPMIPAGKSIEEVIMD